MKNKLESIFTFLNSNRQYNQALQERYYQSIISPFKENKDKIISLIYNIANTQSRPKIDNLALFYKFIHRDLNCFLTFREFIDKINPNKPLNFESLFNGMEKQKGWGKKTAALFTKSIYHLHSGFYSTNLKIWKDVPNTISDDDYYYLPVDSVIINIFNMIDKTNNWDFDKINKILKQHYNNQQIEIWDDLWFWGFITQNGSGNNRQFIWNENKYWVLKESDKNELIINEIKHKSNEFLKILRKLNY